MEKNREATLRQDWQVDHLIDDCRIGARLEVIAIKETAGHRQEVGVRPLTKNIDSNIVFIVV